MRGYQRIAWLGNVLLSSCPDCGGVVSNRERHDAWHDGPPAADPITFSDTCCGKCTFGTCYVDQMTGA